MNSIDDLINWLIAQYKENKAILANTGENESWRREIQEVMITISHCIEKTQELKANIEKSEKPYVELPCLKCGEKYIFDKRSSHAKGIFEFHCNDLICMGKNPF